MCAPILQEGKLRLGQGDFPHSLSQTLNGNVSPFGADLRTHGFQYEAMTPGSFRWPQLRTCTQRDRGGWDWGRCLSKTLGTSTHLTDMPIRDLLQVRLGWAPPDLISFPLPALMSLPAFWFPGRWRTTLKTEAWTPPLTQQWAQHKPGFSCSNLHPVFSWQFQLPRRKTSALTQPLSLKSPSLSTLPANPDQAHRPKGATAQPHSGRSHFLEINILCFGSLFLEERKVNKAPFHDTLSTAARSQHTFPRQSCWGGRRVTGEGGEPS